MIHAPCPVLVLPYRALGLAESLPQRGDMSPDEIISPREASGTVAEETEGLSAARLRLAKMSAPAAGKHRLLTLHVVCDMCWDAGPSAGSPVTAPIYCRHAEAGYALPNPRLGQPGAGAQRGHLEAAVV